MDYETTFIRINGAVQDSIVDGPGLRFVLFTQGCKHQCNGCHNPDTHDFNGGKLASVQKILAALDKNPLTQGVTFSGGEPFEQPKALLPLAREIKKRNLHLMCYSGYTFEQLTIMGQSDADTQNLLHCIDTLVDGKFDLQQRSLNLLFRGSKNQRILDVAASLQANAPIWDTKITGREDMI